jgi:hypothetical protein
VLGEDHEALGVSELMVLLLLPAVQNPGEAHTHISNLEKSSTNKGEDSGDNKEEN